MTTTLWPQNMQASTWIVFALSLLPWVIFIKMANDLQDLLSLESSDREQARASVPGSARGKSGQALLAKLQAEKLNRDSGARSRKSGWDIEMIIPAYNEERNIKSCIQSIVSSALCLFEHHGLRTRLIVVDDRSSDRTHAIATDCQNKLEKELEARTGSGDHQTPQPPVSITVLTSDERPMGEIWLGKTWASHTGFLASKSEHLFFIDADVTLKEPFLNRFLNTLQRDHEFAGFIPAVICKSLVDYIVQPHVALGALVMNKVSSSLDSGAKKPHAFGQCVYISKRAYVLTGGYEAVKGGPFEGLETRGLSLNIVRNGISAKNIAGGGLIDVYMYHDSRSLWEGWTKNFFVSVDKNVFRAFNSVVLALVMFDLPLFFLFLPGAGLLILLFICGHLAIRILAHRVYRIPLQGWFLFPLGGLAIAILMIGSAYKVLSGKDWTWKGRSLAAAP